MSSMSGLPRISTPSLAALMAAVLFSTSPSQAAAPSVPHGRTPAHLLDVVGLCHHEVLRIDPGPLGPSGEWDVVIDAWTSSTAPQNVEGVRVWWLDRESNDERSPFGPTVRKRIRVEQTRISADKWTIAIVTDNETFAFTVTRTDRGKVVAYANVLDGSQLVTKCRATQAALIAKRFLGIPVGLKRVDVSCVDDDGKPHHGAMR